MFSTLGDSVNNPTGSQGREGAGDVAGMWQGCDRAAEPGEGS